MRSGLLRVTKQQWAVILLAGLLLTVAALPVSGRKRSGSAGTETAAAGETPEKSVLEAKLESILSRTEGVGEVEVFLMTGREENSGTFSSQEDAKVTGVLVAAAGGDDPVTEQNIKQAVMALFQVEAHKIKVMKMK